MWDGEPGKQVLGRGGNREVGEGEAAPRPETGDIRKGIHTMGTYTDHSTSLKLKH